MTTSKAKVEPALTASAEAVQQTFTGGSDLMALFGSHEQATYRVPVIFWPDGTPKSGFIVVGRASPQYQGAYMKIRIKNTQASAIRGNPLDIKTDEGAEVFIRTLNENVRLQSTAATVGWFGWEINGVDAVFDPDMVQTMFNRNPSWEESVLAAVERDANFIKG
jgi:hypothetical protein